MYCLYWLGISLNAIIGDNGIINNTQKAKFVSEVRDIEEQINVYYVSGEKNMKYGTINGTLNIDSDYNEILLIENEKLVYDPNIVSKQQKEWLEELGISERGNFYLVMNEATKSKFEGQKNIGTLKEFKELINNGTFNYDIIYLVENIDYQV